MFKGEILEFKDLFWVMTRFRICLLGVNYGVGWVSNHAEDWLDDKNKRNVWM